MTESDYSFAKEIS